VNSTFEVCPKCCTSVRVQQKYTKAVRDWFWYQFAWMKK
jgi:uncharacterized C2H2 Zn-finger protein